MHAVRFIFFHSAGVYAFKRMDSQLTTEERQKKEPEQNFYLFKKIEYKKQTDERLRKIEESYVYGEQTTRWLLGWPSKDGINNEKRIRKRKGKKLNSIEMKVKSICCCTLFSA